MSDPKVIFMNNGHTFVLNIIDLYSKKAWSQPLKSKSVQEIVRGLKEIFKTDGPPKILQSDNGTEFKNTIVDDFLKKNNVKSIHSIAYKPTSQGAIERFNQTLKHLIFQHFTQFNTKKYTDVLPLLVENYNTTIHSSTREKPNNIHNLPQSKQVLREIKIKARDSIQHTQKQFVNLQKGDFVRVHVNNGNSFKKSYKSQWSKLAYIVISRSKPKTPLLQPGYKIQGINGLKITNSFSRRELLKVPPPEEWGVQRPNRPDFSNGEIFDREAHLRKIQNKRRQAATTSIPAALSLPSRNTTTQPSRNRVQTRTQQRIQDAQRMDFTINTSIRVPAAKLAAKPAISKNEDLAAKYGLQNFVVRVPLIKNK